MLADYGEIAGASHAHYVRASNGSEYIAKGPIFAPDQPTVAANEFVAAHLAEAVGLPLLDYRVLDMNGDLLFASAWMDKGSFATGIEKYLLERCVNQDIVYELVVFDAWLCNTDRHNGNLIVRLPKKPGEAHVVILNDHSHLLVSQHEPTPEGLLRQLDTSPRPYVSLPFVREAIVSKKRLGQAVIRAEAVPEAVVRTAVQATPEALLPGPFREVYERFLIERQARLRKVFKENLDVFPNLEAA
ncbi:hypothetical protein BH20ACT17_BH20ACT17_13350 [soil metagenome]